MCFLSYQTKLWAVLALRDMVNPLIVCKFLFFHLELCNKKSLYSGGAVKFHDIWNQSACLQRDPRLICESCFKREMFNYIAMTCVYLHSKCNWIMKLSRNIQKLDQSWWADGKSKTSLLVNLCLLKKRLGYKNYFPSTTPLFEKNKNEISTDVKNALENYYRI